MANTQITAECHCKKLVPLTDEQIKKLKPLSADFVSFRAGVRCMEREYAIGGKR